MRRACCLLWSLALVAPLAAAEEGVGTGDDTAIPALTPEALEAWWPGLSPHLPRGFVSVSGEAMPGGGGDGPMASASVWTGGFAHPSPRWSWGAAVGFSERRWGMGDPFPARSRTARVAVGAWRRFSLDDHLLLIAAPGATWSGAHDGVSVSVPIAGLWVHRAGRRLTWAAGAVALVGPGDPIAFPVAGAIAMHGPWTFVITPLFLSAERLLDADSAVSAFAGLSGDQAPVEVGGRDAWATYWDLRVGVRARTRVLDDLGLGAEAGCAVVRRASVALDGRGGDTLATREPAAAPYAAITATWSW